MSTETALTEFEIDNISARVYEARATHLGLIFARAIEQAVLQSDEVQALRKDAALWRFVSTQHLVLGGGSGKFGWPLAPVFKTEWDRYVNAAMEKQL